MTPSEAVKFSPDFLIFRRRPEEAAMSHCLPDMELGFDARIA